jgi:hypothetical protein
LDHQYEQGTKIFLTADIMHFLYLVDYIGHKSDGSGGLVRETEGEEEEQEI